MSIQKIAGRYAKSLIDLAIEQQKLEVIKEDVKLFKSVTANREFYLVMKSPIINSGKKQSILKAIFEGKVDATTMAFLDIIAVKGREGFLPEIADAFMDQYNSIHQMSKLKVTTAMEKGSPPLVRLEGIDKELLGQVCAKIRGFRKPEPYKGKGIMFKGEIVRRKAGKTAGGKK